MKVFQGLGHATPAHTPCSEVTAHEAAILHKDVQLSVIIARQVMRDQIKQAQMSQTSMLQSESRKEGLSVDTCSSSFACGNTFDNGYQVTENNEM